MDKMETVKLTTSSGYTEEYFNANGLYFPTVALDIKDPTPLLKNLSEMKARDEDVLVCGGLRSGTNWMWEIVNMLVNNKPEYQRDRKLHTLLEWQDQEYFEEMKSPRVLSSHLRFKYIPSDFIDKKCKIVYMQRNPKDVVVSFYNYSKDEFDMKMTWEDCLELFVNAIEDIFGSWFGITKSWEEAIQNCPGNQILLVYYENLKKNPIEEVTRIARFLGFRDDPEFIKEVAEKISFSNMKKAKVKFLSEALKEDRVPIDNYPGNTVEARSKYYRKGEVGDWKNYFTVAQNEDFDKMMEEKMKSSKLEFIYTI